MPKTAAAATAASSSNNNNNSTSRYVIATNAEQWAAQAPTLLLSHAPACTAAAIATPRMSGAASAHSTLKRRHSASHVHPHVSPSKRHHKDELNGPHDAAASGHVVVSAPLLGVQSATEEAYRAARRCAPSFAVIPNALVQHHVKSGSAQAAAAAAAAAAATPAPTAAAAASQSSMCLTDAMPTRLSKKHGKLLAHDLSAYCSSLSKQSSAVVVELMPARILALTKLEAQFERELAEEAAKQTAAPAVSASASAIAAAATFEAQQQQMADSTASGAVLAALPVASSPDEALALLHPITSLTQHAPHLHPSLPALGSKCVHHGWTFHQPTRAHPIDAFNSRWVRIVKAELNDMASLISLLRCSLTLTLPEASDANNVRIEIADELFSEMRYKEEWCVGLKGRLVSYSLQRAKFMSKVVKYPGAADYTRAVGELDEYTRLTLQQSLVTLRNSYLLLHALYEKNMDKLLIDPAGDQAFQSML